jgi:arylsulfatase
MENSGLGDRDGGKPRGLTRKEFLLAASAVAGLAACKEEVGQSKVAAAPAPAVHPGRRHNILMIVTDQERANVDLPPTLPLPNHERLRARGVNFTNFHVTTSPCSPSRSVIYTGRHTKYTRVLGNPGTALPAELDTSISTVGTMLREQGYYTAYKGKWHLSPLYVILDTQLFAYPTKSDALEPFGFSDYSVMGDRLGGAWDGFMHDREIASEAAQWLHGKAQTLPDDQPWFLAVNLVNPHDMMFFDAGGDQRATQALPDLLQPLRQAPGMWPYSEDLAVPLPRSHYQDDLSTKPWAHRAFREVNNAVFGRIGDEAAWARAQNYYFNCIRDADQYVGVVLDALKTAGLADNTIVMLTADHGEMAGAHGLREKGPCVYKENVRVPFIIHHPDMAGGRDSAALGSALDLAPTILALAGLEDGERQSRYPDLKGIDLSPAIGTVGGTSARDARGMLFYFGVGIWADPQFTQQALKSFRAGGMPQVYVDAVLSGKLGPSMRNRALFRGIYDGRYKFARYFEGAKHNTPADLAALFRDNDVELYDTQTDPDELVNLANDREANRELLTRLNASTNAAVVAELSDGDKDDGSEFD